MRRFLTAIACLLIPSVLLAQAPPSMPSFQPVKSASFDGSILGKAPVPAPAPALPPPPIIQGLEPLPPVSVTPKIWSGGFELGLSGSEGNSQVFKLRLGFDAKRETADNIFTSIFWYGYSTQGGIVNENKSLSTFRDEVLFVDSPFSVFGQTTVEYDQFRAYDFRVGLHAGLGYQWVKNDSTTLRTRVGAGAVREIGGPQDRWVPELLLGYDFEHKFTSRTKFVSSTDLFPSLENLAHYRLRSRAALEILLDADLGLALRLGIQDRYDSNAGGAKRNDVDYFATLLFHF